MDETEKQPKPTQAPSTTHAERIAHSWQEITGHCQELKGSSTTRHAPLAARMHAILADRDATEQERYRAERWFEVNEERVEAAEMHERDEANATAMQAEMAAAGFSEAPKHTRARRIPGAQDRLNAPATHKDTEHLREHLKRHPSATAPTSAGR